MLQQPDAKGLLVAHFCSSTHANVHNGRPATHTQRRTSVSWRAQNNVFIPSKNDIRAVGSGEVARFSSFRPPCPSQPPLPNLPRLHFGAPVDGSEQMPRVFTAAGGLSSRRAHPSSFGFAASSNI